ncbi:MAG: hypothetical protein OXF56_01620 [Rhodobacteraceae bacterium]|nr:hypothetical protein [Paracoccaceae bacterium]
MYIGCNDDDQPDLPVRRAAAADGVSAANPVLVPGAFQGQQAMNSTGKKISGVRLEKDENI